MTTMTGWYKKRERETKREGQTEKDRERSTSDLKGYTT